MEQHAFTKARSQTQHFANKFAVELSFNSFFLRKNPSTKKYQVTTLNAINKLITMGLIFVLLCGVLSFVVL